VLKILLDRSRQFGLFPDTTQKSFMPVMDIKAKTRKVCEVDKVPPDDLGVNPGLIGAHQVENAYTAVIVSGVLFMDYDLHISDDQTRTGLRNARHPGRLEFNGQYLFDGAHNVGGAKVLRKFLDDFVDQPVTMIFGAVKGKDVSDMAESLFPKAEQVILTNMANSRAMTAREIKEVLPQGANMTSLDLATSVAEALAKAESMVGKKGLIVVTGSLYLVGEVKRVLKSQI